MKWYVDAQYSDLDGRLCWLCWDTFCLITCTSAFNQLINLQRASPHSSLVVNQIIVSAAVVVPCCHAPWIPRLFKNVLFLCICTRTIFTFLTVFLSVFALVQPLSDHLHYFSCPPEKHYSPIPLQTLITNPIPFNQFLCIHFPNIPFMKSHKWLYSNLALNENAQSY